jgi:exosome complex component MTR3
MQNCYFPVTAAPREGAAATLDEKALRLDRLRVTPDDLRPTFMKLGVVSSAAGSAYVELHRTRVLCSVYGPRNDTRSNREFNEEGQLVCDFKFAPFADADARRERGQDDDELEFSSILVQALSPAVILSKLPKCVVSIYVVVLESDGGALAAAINCASLALVDAAVEMYDIVTAASAGVISEQVVLDPSREEERSGQGSVLLSFMPSIGRMTHMLQSGSLQHEQLQEAADLCTDACTGIVKNMLTAAIAQAITTQ